MISLIGRGRRQFAKCSAGLLHILSRRSRNGDRAYFSLRLSNSDYAIPLVIALAQRCIASLFAAYVSSSSLIPALSLDPQGYQGIPLIEPRGWNLLFAPFQRWDGIWYQLIAEQGYSATNLTTAYFPLFPALIRPLMAVIPNATVPAQIIAFISTAIAFVIFYREATRFAGKRAAVWGLLAWAAFPTTFFLFAPYAESVFVLCSLSSLAAARKRHWWLAGILAGFAALARSPGILIVLPLGVEYVLAHGVHRILWSLATIRSWAKCNLRSFFVDSLAIGLVPLAVCGYMLYLYVYFGDPLLWQHALASWHWIFVPPWETVGTSFVAILAGNQAVILNNLIDLITTLIILAALVIGLIPHLFHRTDGEAYSGPANVQSADNAMRLNTNANTETAPIATLPISYIVYGLVFAIGPLMTMLETDQVGLPLYAAGRRAIVIFPAFMIIGSWLKDRSFRLLYLAASFGVQLILVSAFALGFWVD